MLKDSHNKYGLISKSIHWLSALVVFVLFGVGLWMVELTYYSEWYKTAPHWHKSIGVLLLIATVIRFTWKMFSVSPQTIEAHSPKVQRSSAMVHYLLYLLMMLLMLSGYLISTADGRSIEVFNWFELASLGELITDQEDVAGLIHEYTAYCLIGLTALHALAAIKHHVIDKDDTLKRML
ncbi:cytochrome b [Thalassotalea atypica]|uniref:cytochrome b n=1 Tax=Thalassotalea atypica TaxID=2054316 RepID=UPI0025746CD3|nr:cytochrome b [Thalassotalea atypica]